MKNLETRTSIRKYANREVSNELLHKLLSLAERTQTMGNLQLYSVNGIQFELNSILVEKWEGKCYRLVIQRQRRNSGDLTCGKANTLTVVF